MKLIGRPMEDLALIQTEIFQDSRGFFLETYRQEWMTKLNIDFRCLQDNHSRSLPGVLRGLHFQFSPPQSQLVSVRRGRIWDVAVDLRKGSDTFGKYFSTELNDTNGLMLLVPSGFAHGFCVLGDEPADVYYKESNYYNGGGEGGVHWCDPDLSINWPIKDPIVSSKDSALPSLKEIAAKL